MAFVKALQYALTPALVTPNGCGFACAFPILCILQRKNESEVVQLNIVRTTSGLSTRFPVIHSSIEALMSPPSASALDRASASGSAETVAAIGNLPWIPCSLLPCY